MANNCLLYKHCQTRPVGRAYFSKQSLFQETQSADTQTDTKQAWLSKYISFCLTQLRLVWSNLGIQCLRPRAHPLRMHCLLGMSLVIPTRIWQLSSSWIWISEVSIVHPMILCEVEHELTCASSNQDPSTVDEAFDPMLTESDLHLGEINCKTMSCAVWLKLCWHKATCMFVQPSRLMVHHPLQMHWLLQITCL